MLEPAYRPTRSDVVAPVMVDPSGQRGPTRARARGPQWRRTSHGFYVPADVDGDAPLQRIAEASVAIPEIGGLTGWAALRWLGATWFDGTADGGRRQRPVTLATCYMDVRTQPGIEICQERLAPTELVIHEGIPVTEPARSVCFEARYARSKLDALVTIEMAAFHDLVSAAEYADFTLERRGWTGVPQARELIDLIDENSWSPMETRLRMRWCLHLGLPPPLANRPLFDLQGRHIGTPDLFDPSRALAVEYDSHLHLTTSRRAVDRDRETLFRDHGVEVATILTADGAHSGALAKRLGEAVDRAERTLPSRTARWTLQQPAWWLPSQTVEQRRALAARGLFRYLPSHRHAA
ncbi:hypothetical protein D9V37_16150 [Nocardioides mangrovicus]|uniref:DUF559 domain-containing protein n=1 Tax=Nocardioides mangrovicus TaxID=2478913 RepID=A0A3L8NWR3_9ACTN|nr:hypothetical protein [Nocardioides mangrovicus]RLV47686.1 hypothetical protein D9V37_16150 [Nocardioides mangrovicus]